MRDFETDYPRDERTVVELARANAERETRLGRELARTGSDDLQKYFQEYRRAIRRVRRSHVLSRVKLGTAVARRALFAGKSMAFSLVLKGLACVVLASAAYLAVNGARILEYVALAEQGLACSETSALRSPDGSIIAAIPGLDCPGRPFLTVPVPFGQTLKIADDIAAIEGEYRRSRTILGQDPRGLARKIYGLLTGQERGFSGPLQSAFETALRRTEKLSLWDKPALLVAGSIFFTRNLRTNEERARFLANNMPAVIGRGYPLAGALGVQALFGGMPQDLAERCLLARAVGFQVRLPRKGGEVTTDMARRWAATIGPGAALCVKRRAQSPGERLAALKRLRAWCGDSDLCMRPRRLEEDQALRQAAYMAAAQAHLPVRRDPGRIGNGAVRAALDGLRLSGELSKQATLDVTLFRRGQQWLDQRLPGLLNGIDKRLAAGVCISRDCAVRPDLMLQAVELRGQDALLRVAYETRHGGIFGPSKRVGQAYKPLPPDWGMASTGKMLIALVAVRNGETRLCSNPKGGEACLDGEWLDTRQALARSHSGAFTWLAARHLGELNRLLDAMGFAPGTMSARDYALGTGRLVAPERFVTFLAALSAGGRSEGVRVGQSAALGTVDLASLGYRSETLAATLDLLGAPLGQGGTLAELVAMVKVPGCKPIAGKTGTHSQANVVIVKTQTILWHCSGRAIVTQARLSTERADRTLGSIRHRDFATLHAAALEAALTE